MNHFTCAGLFKVVGPQDIIRFFPYLKLHNPHFFMKIQKKGLICYGNRRKDFQALLQDIEHSIPLAVYNIDEDDVDTPQMIHETTFIREASDMDGATTVSPRQGQIPLSLLNDEFSEELLNAHLFSFRKIWLKYAAWGTFNSKQLF